MRDAGLELPGGAPGRVVLTGVAEAAKKKLSVVREIDISAEADGDAAASGAPADAAPGLGLRVRQADPKATVAVEGAEVAAAVRVPREKLESLSEPLLQRLKAPLYEVALSAGISLPGEYVAEKKGKETRKAKAKVRQRA